MKNDNIEDVVFDCFPFNVSLTNGKNIEIWAKHETEARELFLMFYSEFKKDDILNVENK
jgi:hypothetical protein